uniref:ATP-dependent DNA helicase n=1 Tax=Octopus bimaculoides TaxID=37653 RepID=A0A0L8GRX3_OCTBM
MKHITIAVTSSGMTATLLSGGCTAHSCLKIPLDLSKKKKTNCNISRGSIKGKLLGECRLIIWDEATIATVLLAGDFKQTLPVVSKGTRADEVNASIKSSYLWSSLKKLRLTTNMKVQLSCDDADGTFSKQLLDVGNGTSVGENDGWVNLPFGHMVSDLKELMHKVFSNPRNQFTCHNWLKTRAILAPKNVRVDDLNFKLLEQLPGEHHIYNSIDTVLNSDEAVNYPLEFLNSLTPPGLPPHNLHLKIGAPAMMLRNLDPPNFCNDTRLIIKKMLHPYCSSYLFHVFLKIFTRCSQGSDNYWYY